MIYLDNSATNEPDPTFLHSYHQVSERYFANPSSIHSMCAEVERLQKTARAKAAKFMQIKEEEVIFTSGGTEGNNLAIKGIAFQYRQRGKHIITTEIEHPSVYEACKSLEAYGFTVTFLPVDEQGKVRSEQHTSEFKSGEHLVCLL